MCTNSKCISEFANGRRAKSSSLLSTGNLLFSYNTVIAERDNNGRVYINMTKYSATTSRAQNEVKRTIPVADAVIIDSGVNMGACCLI